MAAITFLLPIDISCRQFWNEKKKRKIDYLLQEGKKGKKGIKGKKFETITPRNRTQKFRF